MDAPSVVSETETARLTSSRNDDNKCCTNSVNWELADSLSMEWYDGHIPESLLASAQLTSTNVQPTQCMRIYPKYHNVPICYLNHIKSEAERSIPSNHALTSNDGMSASSFVYYIDDAVPLEITNAIYHYTTQTNLPHKTWGSYITMQQIQQYWNNATASSAIDRNNCNNANCGKSEGNQDVQSKEEKKCHLDTITVPAAAYFMKNYVSAHSDAQNGYNLECPNLFHDPVHKADNPNLAELHDSATLSDTNVHIDVSSPFDHDRCSTGRAGSIYDEAHGIAIWALASEIGSEVPYHIDYAELLRYETGIIVPPIIAGTWHCTRNPNQNYFRGGDYCVVSRENGLDHYHKHGYKGKLNPVDDISLTDNHKSNDILQIPYQFNRMICQSGHLPHWSTRVEAPFDDVGTLNGVSSVSDPVAENVRRVIVGFNVFLHDVGPIIEQAPEHSEAFRKRVSDKTRPKGNISLQAFTTNPQLRRVLVLAKRQKSLNNFKQAQSNLDDRMHQFIDSKNERVTVGELLDAFTPSDSANHWPFDANDVLVQIHNACKKGFLRATAADKNEVRLTKLIGPEMYIECCSKEQGAMFKM